MTYALMFDTMEEATRAINTLSEQEFFMVNMRYIPDREEPVWAFF